MQQFQYPGRNDRSDDRNTADRASQPAFCNATAGDGDGGRSGGKRCDGDVHGSGADGSERHIRGWSEYGNDRRERRGHLGRAHSEYDGRRLYGDGLGYRSDGDGHLQSHEHRCLDLDSWQLRVLVERGRR